ncbi:MAG: DUF4394 domain-containing protein [Verrucomicrobiota bacterium]|nr:DUF4394 domain-containing protein [Verrucomicrobiota bacterium]
MRKISFVSLLLCAASFCIPRSAPAELVYGLTAQGGLISFDSATPGSVSTVGNISGASSGQFFLGIDFRASNGLLYGLAVNTITGASNIYTINLATAAASLVGTTPFTLSTSIGGRVGMDFDQANDMLRVITRNGSNYRVNPNAGSLFAQDTTLTYTGGVPSQTPDSVAIAYAPNSTLYSYTFDFDEFVRIGGVGGMPSANGGECFAIGGSGTFPLTSNVGFDISQNGTAYLFDFPNASRFFTVDLATGHATLVGPIGGSPQLVSLAVAPVPEPATALLLLGAGLLASGCWIVRRRRAG